MASDREKLQLLRKAREPLEIPDEPVEAPRFPPFNVAAISGKRVDFSYNPDGSLFEIVLEGKIYHFIWNHDGSLGQIRIREAKR